MKKIAKGISVVLTLFALLSYLCACSSLVFAPQLSDKLEAQKKNTQPPKVTTSAKVTTKKAVSATSARQTTITTASTSKRLTQAEISQIRKQITEKYQNQFNAYEKEYKKTVSSLKEQIADLEQERLAKLTSLRNNMIAMGMLNSGQYETQVRGIDNQYAAKIYPLSNTLTELENEYTSLKNNLQKAINQAVQDEINRLESK